MNSDRPVIGLTAAVERARWTVWDRRAYVLAASYVNAVQRGGGIAVLLPTDHIAIDSPETFLRRLDGLILTGGADIDPQLYGAAPSPNTEDTRIEQDRFEMSLVRGALEMDLPLLGICRGMQVINVACGGTLIQHLPDDLGHGNHRRTLGSFENADHDVELQQASLAASIIGESLHSTKSHHHQGVDLLGEGLRATGWSVNDRLVEAIEYPDRRFALGVQWHPEIDDGSPIVAGLIEAAGEYAYSSIRG